LVAPPAALMRGGHLGFRVSAEAVVERVLPVPQEVVVEGRAHTRPAGLGNHLFQGGDPVVVVLPIAPLRLGRVLLPADRLDEALRRPPLPASAADGWGPGLVPGLRKLGRCVPLAFAFEK
jgi:hypothetical protein